MQTNDGYRPVSVRSVTQQKEKKRKKKFCLILKRTISPSFAYLFVWIFFFFWFYCYNSSYLLSLKGEENAQTSGLLVASISRVG
jgi:hypothetical protein